MESIKREKKSYKNFKELEFTNDPFTSFLNKNIASLIAQFLTFNDFFSISFCNKACFIYFLKNQFSRNSLYYSNNNSKILPFPKYFKQWSWLIKKFENFGDNFTLNYLFNAKENDFSADKFHEICDKKKPVLVIVKTENNTIFGGFADAAFDVPNDGFKYEKIGEKKAFIFSITRKSVHPWKKEKVYGIISEKSKGPKFNGGFCIGDRCDIFANENNKYYCLPNGVQVFSKAAKAWLSGSNNDNAEFKVLDYEVWQLLFWNI